MTTHRITYYSKTLKRIETARYRDDNGNELVIESCHANLTDITDWPVAGWTAPVGVYRATDADGREVYIRKVRDKKGTLQRTGSRGTNKGDTLIRYCPGDEWGYDKVYDSIADAEAADPGSAACQAEREEMQAMLERATAAAADSDGDESGAWSRAAYEAACTAAGLADPASDEDALRLAGPGGGVYSIPEYHREHVVWAQLARRRAAGIKAETVRAEQTALERAEQAAGTGPYRRAEYESACAAAGIDALRDADIVVVLEMQLNNQFGEVRDVLGGIAVKQTLGDLPQTAATLAGRREAAMHDELDQQRAAEREALAAAGTEFATEEQVSTIMRLLARRARSGEGGGFFMGPTDPGGVANLSKQEASAYITSLRGEY